MINAEKVRLMASTEMYEESSKGDNLKLRAYCGQDARKFSVRTALTGVLIYILIMLIVAISIGTDITALRDMPVALIFIAVAVLVVGIAFVVLYTRTVRKTISSRYRNVRSSMTGYDLKKKKLRMTVQEGKPESISTE